MDPGTAGILVAEGAALAAVLAAYSLGKEPTKAAVQPPGAPGAPEAPVVPAPEAPAAPAAPGAAAATVTVPEDVKATPTVEANIPVQPPGALPAKDLADKAKASDAASEAEGKPGAERPPGFPRPSEIETREFKAAVELAMTNKFENLQPAIDLADKTPSLLMDTYDGDPFLVYFMKKLIHAAVQNKLRWRTNIRTDRAGLSAYSRETGLRSVGRGRVRTPRRIRGGAWTYEARTIILKTLNLLKGRGETNPKELTPIMSAFLLLVADYGAEENLDIYNNLVDIFTTFIDYKGYADRWRTYLTGMGSPDRKLVANVMFGTALEISTVDGLNPYFFWARSGLRNSWGDAVAAKPFEVNPAKLTERKKVTAQGVENTKTEALNAAAQKVLDDIKTVEAAAEQKVLDGIKTAADAAALPVPDPGPGADAAVLPVPGPGPEAAAALDEAQAAIREAEETVRAAEARAVAAEAAAAATEERVRREATEAQAAAVTTAEERGRQEAAAAAAAAQAAAVTAAEERGRQEAAAAAAAAVTAAEERGRQEAAAAAAAAQAAAVTAAVTAAENRVRQEAAAAQAAAAQAAAAQAAAAAPGDESSVSVIESPLPPGPRNNSASSVVTDSSLPTVWPDAAGPGLNLPGVPQRSALSDAVDALKANVDAIKKKVAAARANGWKTRRMNEAIREATAVGVKRTAEEKHAKMITTRAERAARNAASVRNAEPPDQRQAAGPVRGALQDADRAVTLAIAARRSSMGDPRMAELDGELTAFLDFLAQTEAEFAVAGEPSSRPPPRPAWQGGRRRSHRRNKKRKARTSTFRRNRKH